MSSYLFQSARLGFRNWVEEDIEPLVTINADPEVMQYFPGVQDRAATTNFVSRMQKQFNKKGYTYFACELLETKGFIGFIGLADQDFVSPWTPFTDIGWRLDKNYWYMGLATEGAQQVLNFGFKRVNLSTIYSVAPLINQASIHVMEKIGMKKIGQFAHPKLIDFPELAQCVVYKCESSSR
jgi:RimJ/RimL family protein N-acetyltransferase